MALPRQQGSISSADRKSVDYSRVHSLRQAPQPSHTNPEAGTAQIAIHARISVLTTLDDTGRCAMDDRRLTLSIDEVAEILGISRGLVYGLVARGELPGIRFGRRILIPKRAVEELVNAYAAPEPTR